MATSALRSDRAPRRAPDNVRNCAASEYAECSHGSEVCSHVIEYTLSAIRHATTCMYDGHCPGA
eukprot:5153027-Pyramimonas_sp.AAC.1